MIAKYVLKRPVGWSAACVGVSAALASAVVSGQAQELAGAYVLDEAQSAADEAARAAAIELAGHTLPDEARSGLQARLEVLTRPAPRVEVLRDANDIVLTAGDGLELRSSADGSAAPIEGGLELRQRMEGSELVQTIEGDNLRGKVSATALVQTLRYIPGADEGMTLETTITGGDLAAPLALSAHYLVATPLERSEP